MQAYDLGKDNTSVNSRGQNTAYSKCNKDIKIATILSLLAKERLNLGNKCGYGRQTTCKADASSTKGADDPKILHLRVAKLQSSQGDTHQAAQNICGKSTYRNPRQIFGQ